MRLVVLGVVAMVLGGCMTTVKNSLSTDEVASFKLAGVEVVVPPESPIRWGDGEIAYASTKGVPALQSDTVARTPEGVAYLRDGVTTRVRTAFQRELGGKLNGTRPVKLRVTVRQVEIASALQRVLIGGNHTMTGDVAIVDAKTGAVLSSYPVQKSMSAAGQGIGGALADAAFLAPPIDRVVDGYASQYREWLLRDGMMAPLRS